MTGLRAVLRTAGVLGIAGALLDPGCAEHRKPVIDVAVVGERPDRAAEVARLAGAAPWAVLRPERDAIAPGAVTRPAARIVVGDPGAVLTTLRERGAALALRAGGDALSIARLAAPTRAPVGGRVEIVASLEGLPASPGRVRVRLLDGVTGVEVARSESATGDVRRPEMTVRVPWVAATPGPVRLRAVAEWAGEGTIRSSSPADVDVDVVETAVTVDVLEARPSWHARFARLALEGARGVTVRNEVRLAPGLTVGADGAPAQGAPVSTAHLTLVGGVDALTTADVTRLATEVRDLGRTVVLVLDDVPAPGAWTRLWPEALGRPTRVSTPVSARVGPHAWRVREWLSRAASTDARPLAYLDEGTPIVWGRALGAGRVVLVTALDAWRWRADSAADFAGGWRALVTSLALDMPRPLALRAWLEESPDGRRVGLEVSAAPATGIDDVQVLMSPGVEARGRAVGLWRVDPGRWRGAAPWPTGRLATFAAEGRRAGTLVARDATVVHVSPPALVAAWSDVVGHQAGVGALAATDGEAPRALSALRAALDAPPGARWYVTRTWWYAALVLAALGVEWILRRLHRER